jgi:uncharacterized protein
MIKTLAFLVTMMLLFVGAGASAQTVAGDWTGAISPTPAQTLHVALHVQRAVDGSYSGTFDSLDQGVTGVPVAVAVAGDALSFSLPGAAPGTFTGKWDATAGGWVGAWKQSGATFPLTLTAGLPPPKPTVTGLDGDWTGALALGSVQLHLILHVKTGPRGTTATVDSPDQLSYGLTVSSIHHDGSAAGFEMSALGASFAGTLSADGQSLAGAWTQVGRTTPLTFARQAAGVAPPKLIRPQTPTKPYPYREEEVTFDDAAAQVKLAGTLTLPPGAGPFPAVVLVAGSGPNTRDEPILGHKPFLVLADHLTRRGIAVLRYDKRGTGASGGDYAKATTMDFASDAQAAAAYLRGRPEIDPKRVGLIGHSEGGLVVPIVATRDPATAFIVMMAGPGVDGADILREQGRLIGKAMGADDAQVAKADDLRQQMFTLVRDEKDPTVAAAKLRTLASDYAKSNGFPESAIDAQIAAVNSDWFRFFFDYDPAPTLAKVRCPVLALDGSLDLQVPPDQNLPPIRAALAHNPKAEVVELPGLNHLFQTAKTGAPGEYVQIEETIAPAALDTITDWVLKQVGTQR